MPDTDRNPDRLALAIYWLTLGVTALLAVYGAGWLGMFVAARFGGWTAAPFGLELINILDHAGRGIQFLFFAILACAAAASILLLRKHRLAVYAIGTGMGLHLVVWFMLLGNPYFSGRPGYVVLPLEGVLLAMSIMLKRRGILR